MKQLTFAPPEKTSNLEYQPVFLIISTNQGELHWVVVGRISHVFSGRIGPLYRSFLLLDRQIKTDSFYFNATVWELEITRGVILPDARIQEEKKSSHLFPFYGVAD
jgi:hypothetical protein